MNSHFNKYYEKGLNLDLNSFNHKSKFVIKSSQNPKFRVLWDLCEEMEEKALISFKNSSTKSKFNSFFQTAKSEYILRPGYHQVMKNLVLKEVSLFVASECITPHYLQKDVCYASQLFVDGKYITYSFVFEKQ